MTLAPAAPVELQIAPSVPQVLELHPVERLIRLTDTENECVHGALPGDRPVCDCWTRARTAALLGQASLDDGCAGLDRAAALDLPIPVPRQGDLEPAEDDDPIEEVAVQTSPNGHGPTTEPTTQEIHDWYMAEADRTIDDVCAEFDLSKYAVKTQFEKAGLPCKPRGGNRASKQLPDRLPDEPPAIENQAPDPETPISGIDAAIIALDLERNRLAEQLRKVEDALDTVRGLAA